MGTRYSLTTDPAMDALAAAAAHHSEALYLQHLVDCCPMPRLEKDRVQLRLILGELVYARDALTKAVTDLEYKIASFKNPAEGAEGEQ